MATGRIILPALAWAPLDGSSGRAPAELDFVQCDAVGATARFARWAFDDGTNNVQETIAVTFRMPDDYGSAPSLTVQWYIAATTGHVLWHAKMMAVTPNAGETIENKTNAYSPSVKAAAPDTSKALAESMIDFTSAQDNDGLAAGDLLMLTLHRVGDHVDDDATGDAYFVVAQVDYTTL